MRRLRAGLVTPPPGGLGSPSGPTTRDCLRWLDAARTKGGESRPDQGLSQKPTPGPRPEARPRGTEIAAVERREAPASFTRRTRQDGRLVRRLALHSLGLGPREKEGPAKGKDYGVPGAAKNTGDDARLNEILAV